MPKIPDQKARQMVTWLLSDPANRRVKFSNIPSVALELELQNHGKKAIQTAFRSQGYGRRTSKKKEFSNSYAHRQMRLEFARWVELGVEKGSISRPFLMKFGLMVGLMGGVL